jgi:peptide/nickel transport system permease protein
MTDREEGFFFSKRKLMRTFLIRRLFSMILVWFGVTLLTFFIANYVPRDPVALRLGPKATPESIAYWRHQYGLDQPLPQQYLHFITNLAHGDLGTSIWSGRPILRDLADYFPASFELALVTFLLAIFVGLPMGILASRSPDGWFDRATQVLANFGLAVPLFWIGLVFQILFYSRLGVLPLDNRVDLLLGAPKTVTGMYILDSVLAGDMLRLANSLKHIILPAVTLSLPAIGSVARMTRASVLDVWTQDYVRAARAKGVPGRPLLWRHVLRNALLPVVTTLGNIFNALLAGVFVVEVVFNWPGLGWYATKVILASDYGAIVSITLVIAVLATFVNLVVDILYAVLDPRIQLT